VGLQNSLFLIRHLDLTDICFIHSYIYITQTEQVYFSVKKDARSLGLEKVGWVHSKLCSIIPMATKMHIILWSFVVLTWMRDTIELVWHVTLWNDIMEM
jgi:hypothetical protein